MTAAFNTKRGFSVNCSMTFQYEPITIIPGGLVILAAFTEDQSHLETKTITKSCNLYRYTTSKGEKANTCAQAYYLMKANRGLKLMHQLTKFLSPCR